MSTHKIRSAPQSQTRQSSPSGVEQNREASQVAAEKLQEYGEHYVAEPARDLGSRLRDYAREKPDVAAMWCFGIGLIVGWKLRG